MKLNKLQRFTAYCIMLSEVEDNSEIWYSVGFCALSLRIFNLGNKGFNAWENNISNYFPELEKRNPNKDHGGYWFRKTESGWKKRIKLLKQCIIETHP